MENSPPIYVLPNELLVKVIEKLPRTQWPALELVDPKSGKFRDAVLLAWGSVREVDIERDFIYAESTTIKGENDHDSQMAKGRLRRQIAQKTESILKKLIDYSPFITSLSGLSLITDDPTLNTTTVQYLARFEHLETIKFANKIFSGRILNCGEFRFVCGIPLINFVQFIESTQSRATLKEIDIERCRIPSDPIIVANFDQRLRAAFVNVSYDPTRQLLQLETISMRMIGGKYPLAFFDGIDSSKLTKLSLGESTVEPAELTTLINGASRLRHLDFAFLQSCNFYANTPVCQGGRLEPNKGLLTALESYQQLSSLGFNWIWDKDVCACHRFEAEFKNMLQTIGPRLVNFAFHPGTLPTTIRMGEIRDIIQNHMPQLKSITLDEWRCTQNPEELRGIADGKELEEIEIISFYIHDRVTMNKVLATIINKSPRLKRFISIYSSPDQSVAADLCKLTELIDLRINAIQLTKENFVAFSQQAFSEKVEVLHLGSIGEGAESGLIKLIAKASQLREFSVEGYVTDRLLECLAESCPNLEKFKARETHGITFDGVQLLVDRCPKLCWLRVVNYRDSLAGSLKYLKLDRYRKLELY